MIFIECKKGIPIEYELFMIERYNSYFTTCRYMEVYYNSYDINYMLVYENNDLIELLVFGNKGNTSSCFNSLVDIDQKIIKECIQKLFEKFLFIKKIEIVASYKKYFLNKSFLFYKADDYVLDLPTTMDEYCMELGFHTRKNIKNRKARLSRDYPQANFVIKFGVEIEEALINKIIQLNYERLKQKGIISNFDSAYNLYTFKYSQYYGCVAYLEIDGVIVSGCISTIINKRLFLHITAYDNNYSKYNVGEICVYQLIQISIEKEISTVHFLWGETELKKRFIAKPKLLFSYYIYKTYSIAYIFNRIKYLILNKLISIKDSKYSNSVRTMIKFFRRKEKMI